MTNTTVLSPQALKVLTSLYKKVQGNRIAVARTDWSMAHEELVREQYMGIEYRGADGRIVQLTQKGLQRAKSREESDKVMAAPGPLRLTAATHELLMHIYSYVGDNRDGVESRYAIGPKEAKYAEELHEQGAVYLANPDHLNYVVQLTQKGLEHARKAATSGKDAEKGTPVLSPHPRVPATLELSTPDGERVMVVVGNGASFVRAIEQGTLAVTNIIDLRTGE